MTNQIDELVRRVEALEERMDADDRRIPTSAVAAKYQTSMRTIERWSEDPKLRFPQPMFVNGRKFWSVHELQEWDRQQVRNVTRRRENAA